MANVKGRQMASSATYTDLEVLKEGAVVTAEWVQANLMRGKVFHARVGSASTPVTLDAAYAATDPDISVDVPDGTAIIPLVVAVIMEVYGTTALFETITLISKTLAAASAGTVYTPINIATRSAGGSLCACYVGPTVTDGNTTGAFELYRNCVEKIATTATGDDDSVQHNNLYRWTYKDYGFAPVIHGEGSLQVWATSQAASGYIQLFWLEFAESELTY